MLRLVSLGVALAMAAGCASSWADMGGTLLGEDFTHPMGVYNGEKFVVVTDRALGCQKVGWVERHLASGPAATGAPNFLALVLARDAGFSMETPELAVAAAIVEGFAVQSADGELLVEPARSGAVTLDAVETDGITGSLSVAFAHDGVGGTFQSEHCVSLDR